LIHNLEVVFGEDWHNIFSGHIHKASTVVSVDSSCAHGNHY